MAAPRKDPVPPTVASVSEAFDGLVKKFGEALQKSGVGADDVVKLKEGAKKALDGLQADCKKADNTPISDQEAKAAGEKALKTVEEALKALNLEKEKNDKAMKELGEMIASAGKLFSPPPEPAPEAKKDSASKPAPAADEEKDKDKKEESEKNLKDSPFVASVKDALAAWAKAFKKGAGLVSGKVAEHKEKRAAAAAAEKAPQIATAEGDAAAWDNLKKNGPAKIAPEKGKNDEVKFEAVGEKKGKFQITFNPPNDLTVSAGLAKAKELGIKQIDMSKMSPRVQSLMEAEVAKAAKNGKDFGIELVGAKPKKDIAQNPAKAHSKPAALADFKAAAAAAKKAPPAPEIELPSIPKSSGPRV